MLLPTVREILRMDPMADALPEVLAGEGGLDVLVRWVHVAETADVARLVSGGELLLATGLAWPRDARGLRSLGRELAEAEIAGLVLELGDRTPVAPRPLVDEFRDAGLPFIVLHREARFVAITEAVHARIIDDQTVALRARDEIRELFTGLSLRGSPADFIVAQAARALGCPVVLEDTGHQVLVAENVGEGEAELDRWEQRSRAAHRGAGEPGWTMTPVEARGMRWGHLVALPGEPHPAGRSSVLEQAAVALALSRLADRDDDEWIRRSHDALLAALLGRRFSRDGGMAARFEAAGFPVAGRVLAGVAVRSRTGRVEPGGAARAVEAATAAGAQAIAAAHPSSPGLLVLVVSARAGRPAADAVAEALASGDAAVVGVGSDAHGIPGLLASVEEAVELSGRGAGGRGRHAVVQRAESRPLLRLVTAFGDDPRLQEYSERMLRPLIEYDLANDGDLVEVLRAYLSHPGNRTRAAAASHLSRSVFYQRIALIEDLLSLDLDDGETVGALHAAVLARRVRG
ncbi:PucR family transcriptional regulator [Leifsonia shinshuensis]|uniref:PucR family transcriptional regulator n=1 Tax=Leifsonia shinshuensis TaxID=150026 RepID=UPI001F50A6C9|nr:PucR family transcriptional regulator [Leifsonia shinshuensis]